MTSLISPSLNLDQNKPRSKFQEKGAKRYKCSCLSNCEVKRLLSIKMLSSTLRKGERKSVDKLARVSVNSNRTSLSSILENPSTNNARVLPAPLERGHGQLHVHQGRGGQALRVQRPVQPAGEEERVQQDPLGVRRP